MKNNMGPGLKTFPLVLALFVACLADPAARGAQGDSAFAPLDQWRAAVLAGDTTALTNLYANSPAARLAAPEHPSANVQQEVAFWSGWKAKGLMGVSIEDLRRQDPAPGVCQLIFEMVLLLKEGSGTRKMYVGVMQAWGQQEGAWRIVAAKRMTPARLKQPLSTGKDLYPASADARAEIAAALGRAASSHKRVLLDFGANCCFDCHVLDEAFHSPEIAPFLQKYFEVVHVDVGKFDKNTDLAEKYGIPLNRGIPAMAVLDSDGKLLFSQKRGEFEAARSLVPEDILQFIKKWRPTEP